jgi:hypothetical protein
LFRRFRSDERAVTEILGYIFGFLASFLLLMMTLVTFGIVVTDATEIGARAELKEVVQRSSGIVNNGLDVGSKRVGATGDADSAKIVTTFTLTIPTRVRGFDYTLTLSSTGTVTAQIPEKGITETSTSLNFRIPSCANAAERTAAPICDISGAGSPSAGLLHIKYEFDTTTNPVTNRIVMS